jgi:hypothetical protein
MRRTALRSLRVPAVDGGGINTAIGVAIVGT